MLSWAKGIEDSIGIENKESFVGLNPTVFCCVFTGV